MKLSGKKYTGNRFISAYEVLVWMLYVGIYKYSMLVETNWLPRTRGYFPFPQLILYAFFLTLYIVPYYRVIGPWFLRKRWHWQLVLVSILYFIFVPKFTNWACTWLFAHGSTGEPLLSYYQRRLHWFTMGLHNRMLMLEDLLTDILAFLSVMFMRYAFENEQKRHALEKDNLQLQLQTLKAQLHPHFLFNTLNSIYGMSLTGAPETPDFILRLSDMMRYVLYDCSTHQVSLDKDLQFVSNYLEMEKKRYPQANIQFEIAAEGAGHKMIAPLLVIPFLENSFKHGAHRITDNGFIKGLLQLTDNQLELTLSNNVLFTALPNQKQYGGVGIENVQKRLTLYYPHRYTLHINSTDSLYAVHLKIQL
ncbi:Histidine kinase [Filimonas lacunae]|uniref:Histidine kinase n=1 Tax=Filimonas lacunae TaxID=477680 RepID=A0A173M9L8_9BACT|nr:sensor histidine kinase [Filimonas lacunae]BAV04233.1 two-component system sensor protein, no kinase domain [Filimonas lacunae]SIT13818.1 Histidine kinase [Filimonas lacunae]